MSVQAVPLSTPVGKVNMEERKRPSDHDDANAPPAKRQNTAATADDGADIKFGPMNSPWQVDLQTFQKDAVLRQMKEYKRAKTELEAELAKSRESKASLEERLIIVNNGLQQFADEVAVVVGNLTILENSAPDSSISQLIDSNDDSSFKSLVDARFSRLKEVLLSLLKTQPPPNADISDFQKQVTRLLAREKDHLLAHEQLRIQLKTTEDKLDDISYKHLKAKVAFNKAKSQASQYMEMQNRGKVETDDTPKVTNGDVPNGVKEVVTEVNEEVKSEKKAVQAELQERKTQISKLEEENHKLNDSVSSLTLQLKSLTDEDYSQTSLFKTLKSQHEDVIKRINDLEARNVQLREEAQKLQAERSAYRNQVDEECRVKCEEAEGHVAKSDIDVGRIRKERDNLHQQKTILESSQSKHDIALREVTLLNQANEDQIKTLEKEVERLRLKVAEVEVQDDSTNDLDEPSLRKEYVSTKSQLTTLGLELSSMQSAVTKFRALATKKVQETAALEQELEKARVAKVRAESGRFNEKNAADAKKAEYENMRRQASKSADIIAQLKDAENKTKELCVTLEKQVAEFRKQLDTLTETNAALNARNEKFNIMIAGHDSQLVEFKNILAAKDAALATATAAAREAEAERAALRSKLADAKKKTEEWKTKGRSNPSEEVANLRTVAYCNTCNNNLKDTLIKTCGHILCEDCAKSRLTNRQRKCPVCMKAFGQGDLAKIHLV